MLHHARDFAVGLSLLLSPSQFIQNDELVRNILRTVRALSCHDPQAAADEHLLFALVRVGPRKSEQRFSR